MNNVEESDRDLLLVSIFTFLTVLSWVFFELIKTVNTSTVKEPVQQVIKPLNPTLNPEILSELIQRDNYATIITEPTVPDQINEEQIIPPDQKNVQDSVTETPEQP
jgi:hypothetical protein